ncbi:MAG: radical SAM protein [Coriobacteriia bacterium]|nr:radical SAM protein [Coriobacteriia bacterium]
MKVLLVRPKFKSLIANLEPLGLEYVAGVLRDINYEYEIFDEYQHSWVNRYNRLARKIRAGGFDCVGFHVNANTTEYIINTTKRLRSDIKDLYVMVGGPEVEVNYLDFCLDSIDFVYHDNGLLSLQNSFKSDFAMDVLAEQTGVCYVHNGIWVIREKGAPANDFITVPDRAIFEQNIKQNFIFLKGSYALMKASFSCPYNCSFCYCTKMNSGVYTERDINVVIDEIEAINHPRIWFVDDSFFINKERVEHFCHEIIKRGIQKQFMAYSRADFVADNADIMPLLYAAGFRDILVGLEAVDDNLLDEYNKKTSRLINETAIKNLQDNNLTCNALFVVNHQFTKSDFKKLKNFIKANNLLWVVIGIFTPYKGTDAYEEYYSRLTDFTSKRLDGLHITIKPENMSSFAFMFQVYWMTVQAYGKLIFNLMLSKRLAQRKSPA